VQWNHFWWAQLFAKIGSSTYIQYSHFHIGMNRRKILFAKNSSTQFTISQSWSILLVPKKIVLGLCFLKKQQFGNLLYTKLAFICAFSLGKRKSRNNRIWMDFVPTHFTNQRAGRICCVQGRGFILQSMCICKIFQLHSTIPTVRMAWNSFPFLSLHSTKQCKIRTQNRLSEPNQNLSKWSSKINPNFLSFENFW